MGHALFVVNIGPQKPTTTIGEMMQKAEEWLNDNGFTDGGRFGEAKADHYEIPGGFAGALDYASEGKDPWDAESGSTAREFKGEVELKKFLKNFAEEGDYADIRLRREAKLAIGDWLVVVDYHN